MKAKEKKLENKTIDSFANKIELYSDRINRHNEELSMSVLNFKILVDKGRFKRAKSSLDNIKRQSNYILKNCDRLQHFIYSQEDNIDDELVKDNI